MLKRIKERLIKTSKYSAIAGIFGAILAFPLSWPVYQGVYVAILVTGLAIIFYASINFIGLPNERRDFFTGKMRHENKDDPDKKDVTLGDNGWGPAFIGVVMIAIALLIEGVFHSL